MKVQSSLARQPRRRALALVNLIAAGVLLAGCGQKGPLTLPKPPGSAASAAATR